MEETSPPSSPRGGSCVYLCEAGAVAFLGWRPRPRGVPQGGRRILEHGVSFDGLAQADVNLVMSHANSYTRGVLGGRCAWDEFVARHGEPGRLFLERLGLRRIPAGEVVLAPFLLGKRFERLAAKAVLRKNGVLPAPGAAART